MLLCHLSNLLLVALFQTVHLAAKPTLDLFLLIRGLLFLPLGEMLESLPLKPVKNRLRKGYFVDGHKTKGLFGTKFLARFPNKVFGFLSRNLGDLFELRRDLFQKAFEEPIDVHVSEEPAVCDELGKTVMAA